MQGLNTRMRYAEITADLIEGVRPAVLYHSTQLESLYEILDSDEIRANTGHRIEKARDWPIRAQDADSRGYISGVSLTRDHRFARRWRSRWHNNSPGRNDGGVILVLDATRLRQKYRIIPIAFWTGRASRWVDDTARAKGDESEEFLIGSIKPVLPYLVQIEVPQTMMDTDDVLRVLPSLFAVRLVPYG